MKNFITFISWLVVLVPIIITIISYVRYSENKKYKRLLIFTLPNFILSIVLPIMMAIFKHYDVYYIENGFTTFLNNIANNSAYAWILLVLMVIQISITTINGVYLSRETIKLKDEREKTKKVTLKLNGIETIILVYVIIIFISFLITDICMLESKSSPVFCKKVGTYLDGGTTTYIGLGYKIIDYNKLGGYTGYKIGTWLMQYDKSL